MCICAQTDFCKGAKNFSFFNRAVILEVLSFYFSFGVEVISDCLCLTK